MVKSVGLRKIHKYLDRFVSIVHDLAACTTALFLGFLFVQVFMRYFFNKPIYGLDELVTALMIWSMSLGFAIVYWENEHATIEFLMKYLPKVGKKIVYFMTNIIVLIEAIVFVPGGIKLFTMQAKTIPLGGLPFTKAYYYALPIIVMGILLFILSAFRAVEYAVTGDDTIMTSKPVEGGVNID